MLGATPRYKKSSSVRAPDGSQWAGGGTSSPSWRTKVIPGRRGFVSVTVKKADQTVCA